jgi:hypothetical protein
MFGWGERWCGGILLDYEFGTGQKKRKKKKKNTVALSITHDKWNLLGMSITPWQTEHASVSLRRGGETTKKKKREK